MTIQEILTTELEKLKSDIIVNHERAGQVASGRTRDSLSVENVSISSGELHGASYLGVLERGRKGGKVPYNFIEILKKWATHKGISFSNEKDFNRWAYFVQKKIKADGTELYRRSPGNRNEDIFDTPIKDFTKRLGEQVGTTYQTQIANEIFNF